MQGESELVELQFKVYAEDGQLPIHSGKVNSMEERYLESNTGCNLRSEQLSTSPKGEWPHDFGGSLSIIFNNISLPRNDIMHFDGQTGQCNVLLGHLTIINESEPSDKSQIFSYLQHYRRGKASTANGACIHLPCHLCHDKEQRILNDPFRR